MATIGQQLLAPEATWRRYDDTDSRIVKIGTGWSNDTNISNYNSGCYYKIGSEYNFKFYGTKLRIIQMMLSTGSTDIEVNIDGVSEHYSAYKSSNQYQSIAYEKTNLSNTIHSVIIKSLTSANSGFDAIDIDSNGYLLHPTLNQVNSINDVKNIGDCIPCRYTALTSGSVGTISELGTCITDEIPVASSATPNGLFYFIYVGKDYLGRKKFIADRNIQHSISWDTLNNAGICSERLIKIFHPNLIANYKFEEPSGSICYDEREIYNGTYVGTTSITGSIGNGRNFNGTSDYISTNLIIPKKFSIKFKIKTTINDSTVRYISNSDNGSGNGSHVQLYQGKLSFSTYNNAYANYQTIASANIISDGNEHTCLITSDGSVAKLYIDDLVTPISTMDISLWLGNIVSTYIGKFRQQNLYYYQGQLDELEIYNDVIKPSDIPIIINKNNINTMRLLTGGTSATDLDNEWDKIIVNSALGGTITPGDNNVWNWNAWSWCINTPTIGSSIPSGTATSSSRTIRGWSFSSRYDGPISSLSNTDGGFRPVLLIEQLIFDKFLIKKDSKYYSIKPEYYDVISHSFVPLTLAGITKPNKEDIELYGFDNLNLLLTSIIKGGDTFKPIDKLDLNIEYYQVK